MFIDRCVDDGVLPRRPRFHGDHYDVPDLCWDDVVAAGATVVTARELVTRLRVAGLRRPRSPVDG